MQPKKPEEQQAPREGGLGGTESRGVDNEESEALAGHIEADEDPIARRERESEQREHGELTEE
jgi:hypothetical protein